MSRNAPCPCLFARVALSICSFRFFFNDTATTEIYTLSLHDALPISLGGALVAALLVAVGLYFALRPAKRPADRKSTRLNSSHQIISYAVFCLKKKKYTQHQDIRPPRPGRHRGERSRRTPYCRHSRYP